mmetsp:Transcript_21213/g.56679  ORF Transcript_21213/g.56679 Transcript_21213/m.56679 type:complete len:206 (+) Transcript_21213:883-1500(+)
MKVGLGEIVQALATFIMIAASIYKVPAPMEVRKKLAPFGRRYTPRIPTDPIERSLWSPRYMAKRIAESDLTQEEDNQFAGPMLAQSQKLEQKRRANVQCAGCQRQEDSEDPVTGVKLSKCARCRVVQYCGKDCQVRDWPTHKPACKRRCKVAAPERLLTLNESISRVQAGATIQGGTTMYPCLFGVWLDRSFNELPEVSSSIPGK